VQKNAFELTRAARIQLRLSNREQVLTYENEINRPTPQTRKQFIRGSSRSAADI
jgi:hypothetical protein